MGASNFSLTKSNLGKRTYEAEKRIMLPFTEDKDGEQEKTTKLKQIIWRCLIKGELINKQSTSPPDFRRI